MTGTSEFGANPFVGPRAFDEGEADYFFGRDKEIAILAGQVMSRRASLFFAQSGAGKSSLLRAGLVPDLTEKRALGRGRRKRTIQKMHVLPILQVGGILDEALASRIDNAYVFNALFRLLPDTNVEDLAKLKLVDAIAPYVDPQLPAGDEGITNEISNGLSHLLIFDQFEELFTYFPERTDEREDFFKQVDELLKTYPQVHVLFSMREDFIARLTSYAILLPDQLRYRFRMERLGRNSALVAVIQPVQRAGREFAPCVAEYLVDNLRRTQQHAEVALGDPAIAPTTISTENNGCPEPEGILADYIEPVHLQIVCRELWDKLPLDRQQIQYADVQASGDVDQALSGFYDSTIQKALELTEVSERQVRTWFSQELITTARTRGLVFRGEEKTEGLPNQTVDLLEDAWIIRKDIRGGDAWYELAHDRLVEPILKSNDKWMFNHQSAITADAQRWKGADKKRYFLTGNQLAESLALIESHPDDFSNLEKEFVIASEKHAQQQAVRRQRLILSGASILVLVLLALTGWALSSKSNADLSSSEAIDAKKVAEDASTVAVEQQELAESEAAQAAYARAEAVVAKETAEAASTVAAYQEDVAQSNQLAVDSLVASENTDQKSLSLLLAVEAVKNTLASTGNILISAEEALRRALAASEIDPVRISPTGTAHHDIGFDQSGERLIAVDEQNQLLQHVIDGGDPDIHKLAPDSSSIQTAVLSPDSTWLATVTDSAVQLWTLADTTSEPQVLSVEDDAASRLAAFSPDGAWLAIGGNNIYVWNVESTLEPQIVKEVGTLPTTLAISSGGNWLAAASESNFIRLWDLSSTDDARLKHGHTAPVRALAFDPESQYLISAGDDHTARVWPLDQPKTDITILRGHYSPITAIGVNSEGSRLATGAEDGSIRMWDLDNPDVNPMALGGLEDEIRHIAFTTGGIGSQDNVRLAAAEQDGRIHIFQDDVAKLIALACSEAGRNLTVPEWRRYRSNANYAKTCGDFDTAGARKVHNRDVIDAFLAAGEELEQDGWDLLQKVQLHRIQFKPDQEFSVADISNHPALTLEEEEVLSRKLLSRKSPQTGPDNAKLWQRSGLFSMPLEPPASELIEIDAAGAQEGLAQISANDRLLAEIWNNYGAILTEIARSLEVDIEVIVGILATVSRGSHTDSDGRMRLRFEVDDFDNHWGRNNAAQFSQYFSYDQDKPDQGHRWRKTPDHPWQDVHVSPDSDWAAYEFARSLSDTHAKLSSRIGSAGLPGTVFEIIGYQSVHDMFSLMANADESYAKLGERTGIMSVFDTIHPRSVLDSLKERDFQPYVQEIYGPRENLAEDQWAVYAKMIGDYADRFARLRITDDSEYTQYLLRVGRIFAAQCDLEGAASRFEAATALDPELKIDPVWEAQRLDNLSIEEEVDCWLSFARSSIKVGSFDDALNHFEEAFALIGDASDSDITQIIVDTLLAQAKSVAESGNVNEAINMYERALAADETLDFDPRTLAEEQDSQAQVDDKRLVNGFGLAAKLWQPGEVLRIRFLDGDPAVHKKVQESALQWTEHANLKFDFGNDPNAEIRISFAKPGSWSYVGTDALTVPRDQPSMNFGWLTPNTQQGEYDRVVLHEFGRLLGLINEHQNPNANIPWDKDAVYAYYMGPPNNWSRSQVDMNLFDLYAPEQLAIPKEFDPRSIMLYPINNRFTIGDFEVPWRNSTLSALDIEAISQLYPFDLEQVPGTEKFRFLPW